MKKRYLLLISALVASTCFAKPISIATGIYLEDIYGKENSYVLESQTNGYTWRNARLPKEFRESQLNAANCIKNQCIAVGHTSERLAKPLIMVNNNNEKWHAAKLPKTAQSIILQTITHTLNGWVAAGITFNAHKSTPYFIYSQDGEFWSEGKIANEVPSNPITPFFAKAPLSCTDQLCLLAYTGYLKSNQFQQPVFLKSTDGGKIWQSITNIKNGVANTNYFFKDLSCTSEACVAVGVVEDYTQGVRDYKPFILQSDVTGNMWTFVSTPHQDKVGYFFKVHCAAKHCNVSGFIYPDKNRDSSNNAYCYPILLHSKNGGKTWQEKLPTNQKDLVAYKMQSLHCEVGNCIAFGNSDSVNEYADRNKLLIAKSLDDGKTWVYSFKAFPIFTSPRIESVKFNGTNWIAAGIKSKNSFLLPYFMVSQDKNEWAIVDHLDDFPRQLQLVNNHISSLASN